jgi:hypothetical protein
VVDHEGTDLVNRTVANGVDTVLSVIGGLPAGTSVAFEAAYGWGWLVELLGDYGFAPHLVHPLRCKAIASAELRNDKVDAAILAQPPRADLLPEAWIAPHEVRWRGRCRATVSNWCLRTLVRNPIHVVLADHGQDRPAGAFNGVGRLWLAEIDLPPEPRRVVDDLVVLPARSRCRSMGWTRNWPPLRAAIRA